MVIWDIRYEIWDIRYEIWDIIITNIKGSSEPIEEAKGDDGLGNTLVKVEDMIN